MGKQLAREAPDIRNQDVAAAHGARQRKLAAHRPCPALRVQAHLVLEKIRPAVAAEAMALDMSTSLLGCVHRHEGVLFLVHAYHALLRPGLHQPSPLEPATGQRQRGRGGGLVVRRDIEQRQVVLHLRPASRLLDALGEVCWQCRTLVGRSADIYVSSRIGHCISWARLLLFVRVDDKQLLLLGFQLPQNYESSSCTHALVPVIAGGPPLRPAGLGRARAARHGCGGPRSPRSA
mmetsp:Transcript_90578/g.277372  ORF Transcript_90578/g.277372 Transcript_90578/m.277372 type:complete len:234 (-) Transcript_90578:7-708(-)